ncbi:acyl-protein thioesterase 1 [Nilaparvata lugens]|uniref:acyl-protein thioesterase 1 n=1 Tax=Nilaparvata lugens TaxID=108931 RepID=UPI000B98773F|nr:acyl-protein thioesterase 1 [Nilaparvata lugens]
MEAGGLLKFLYLFWLETMASAPVVIAAATKHNATIIFLHGLGDTGNGWAGAIGEIRPSFMKVVCPTAPTQPVTLNNGIRMPSWFDLRTLDANGPEDEAGIKSASQQVHAMIENEVKEGVPSDRIVLGGFSQGGALALYSALTYAKPLAGVVALSCWLPLHKHFPQAAIGNREMPILQCHGNCDPIVPYKWGQMTASVLKTFVKQVEFRTYQCMMHTSSKEEMEDVKNFVAKLFPM